MNAIFNKENRISTLNGVLFVALFSMAAILVADVPFLKKVGISPLIVGILIGVFYANTLRSNLPKEWVPGILFSTKSLLRLAIILYGFRISFQEIGNIGYGGILMSIIMVGSTFILSYWVGVKWMNYDKETTMLIGSGSSICGAAAILATEPVLNSKPYKSVVAVSTVVVFGTISMFLYPMIYRLGILPIDDATWSLFVGGTIHEVAHVVGAGTAINPEVATSAIIVKMLRVMLIAPFLIILSLWLARSSKSQSAVQKMTKISIPWFAVLFIVMSGVHSLDIIPHKIIGWINTADNFLLTMAMTALGMETNVSKFKQVGMKPLYISLILYAWLFGGGLLMAMLIQRTMG